MWKNYPQTYPQAKKSCKFKNLLVYKVFHKTVEKLLKSGNKIIESFKNVDVKCFTIRMSEQLLVWITINKSEADSRI